MSTIPDIIFSVIIAFAGTACLLGVLPVAVASVMILISVSDPVIVGLALVLIATFSVIGGSRLASTLLSTEPGERARP